MLRKLMFILALSPLPGLGQTSAVVFDSKLIEEKVGDLDGDGMEERVQLLCTDDSTQDGEIRELRVLKKKGREWLIWMQSRSAVLPSRAGGRHGDPFEYLEIEKGILLIRQSGGNSWKWGQTDYYKYENGQLQLVSYTSRYGKTCEYWTYFNITLSSGRVIYKKEFEKCPQQTNTQKKQFEKFKFKLRKKITIENRYEELLKVVTPRHKQEIYF